MNVTYWYSKPFSEYQCGLILFSVGGGPVEALRYKTKGQGFDSRWDHLDFSLTSFFRLLYDPGVESASSEMNTNDIS